MKQKKREEASSEWEDVMAWNIFLVEKECKGQRICYDYPLLKFYSLLENLEKYAKKIPKK